jgi:hypothetical protein
MVQSRVLFRTVVMVAALIIAYQIFVPPIVGLSDQGDFRRMIGKFGYTAEQPNLQTFFVARKYVQSFKDRVPEWEQFTSEYVFVIAALGLNKVVSKDGKLDILVIGLIHAIAFLAAFVRLLQVTSALRTRAFVWIAMLFILTDVAYVAYLNTFFTEPASLIFFMLLVAESIDIARSGGPTRAGFVRWSLWAVLFIFAKPMNALPGILLGVFAFRFLRSTGRLAWGGAVAILASAATAIATAPQEMKNANTYNLVFLSVLPESRNPADDLRALGLDWRLQDYSRTGAWSPNTIYPTLEASGDIGHIVTQVRVLRFYLARPTRLWRHIQAYLPIAMVSRPKYGNFEMAAGDPALSHAFALWSDLHAHVLSRAAKVIFFLLLAPSIAVAAFWRRRDLWMEFAALLGLLCMTAFLTAIFGDAWDDIKHLFLFNLSFDALFVASAGWAASLALREKKKIEVAVAASNMET